MSELSEKAIIEKINMRESFTLKIEKYEPAFSAAIHDGGNFRSDLAKNCLLSQKERYYEEDPYTASFIAQQPITLIAHDSRYEYDLNRNTEECVYEMAWGKYLPVFNLSSSTVKNERWRPVINKWINTLKKMQVNGTTITAAENV